MTIISDYFNSFNALNRKRKFIYICIATLTLFIGYRYLTYQPGYCRATGHLTSDAEFIEKSVLQFNGLVRHYGGFDAWERRLVSINRNPEEAGRDFDTNDPKCCSVYRGESDAQKGCGIDDYPICVRLRFPPLKNLPEDYKREGRTYLFDDCGNLREEWGS